MDLGEKHITLQLRKPGKNHCWAASCSVNIAGEDTPGKLAVDPLYYNKLREEKPANDNASKIETLN